MDKAKDRQRTINSASSLKDEVKEAVGKGRDYFVWLRDDGAVCFGDECVVLNRNEATGELDMEVKPDRCGAVAGEKILDHLIRTAGKGVHIHIPPIEGKK